LVSNVLTVESFSYKARHGQAFVLVRDGYAGMAIALHRGESRHRIHNRPRHAMDIMSVLWIVLAVLGALVLLLFAVMDRAKREDRASRHIQHSINPFDDITITRPGR
jgi:heme/copper-type cytochrome/quinol oxidase subunit 2